MELTYFITTPQDSDKLNNYIAILKKREYERDFKHNLWVMEQEKKRKAKMKKELNKLIEKYRQDEIDI